MKTNNLEYKNHSVSILNTLLVSLVNSILSTW